MDLRTIIFDVQRTDDREWLRTVREEVTDSLIYSEEELVTIYRAIDERCSQLNLLEMEKQKPDAGGQKQDDVN